MKIKIVLCNDHSLWSHDLVPDKIPLLLARRYEYYLLSPNLDMTNECPTQNAPKNAKPIFE